MTKELTYKGITNKLYKKYNEFAEAEGTDKTFIDKIYNHTAEQLFFNGGYDEEQIKRLFKLQTINPDYYQDEEHYMEYGSIDEYVQQLFENMTKDMEEKIQNNTEIMGYVSEFIETIEPYLNYQPEANTQEVDRIIKQRTKKQNIQPIKKLLEQINNGVGRGENKEKVTTELVDLLETEEQMFTVYFPDDKQQDGYKGKYYYINPKTNSYEENTRKRLQQLFNDKYGVKLHKQRQFYYDILDRVFESKTEQPHIVEMENVYIDRRNYKIIPKSNHEIMFTTDRLTYTTYDTHELRLFHYDNGILLDDLLENTVKMTFPMECVYKTFVPRTKPEATEKLRMFLQYMGLMIIGRNPAKLILILYDLEDERVGNKGRTTLFKSILERCFPQTFVKINKDVFNDSFKMDTYKHGKHGVFMDEIDKDTLIKFHTVLKELINGSGNSGGAMYTREQIQIESLPLLIGSNGLPDPPLFDGAFMNRLLPIELPNQFVDETKVVENTNTYPKITNIDDMIEQNIEGMGQLISVAINEFLQLDLTTSLDSQFAIKPDIDRTIQLLTKNNVVYGLLKTYTEPVARGTDVKKDWVTTTDILTRIGEAYKRATGNNMDTHEVNEAKIGTLIKQLYPNFITQKGNKSVRDKTYYNIKLFTYEEVKQRQNEILQTLPIGDNQFLNDPLQRIIYQNIDNGINTIEKLHEEINTEYSRTEIDETLEELYDMGLIIWTNTQSL